MIPRLLTAAALAAAIFATSACAGYRLNSSRPKFMGDIQTVAVPIFKNETLEPRIDAIAAGTLIKQIQQDGTYKVAPIADADAILQGTITEIRRSPARSVRGNVLATREFELFITIRYTVTRRVSGAAVESQQVVGNTSFFIGGDVQQDERQAIPLALEDAAIQIVSQISEGW